MSEDPLLPRILLLIVLIAFNALCSAAEAAMTALSEGKLRRMTEEGDREAARLNRLLQDPENVLAAVRGGITLAGFLAAALASEMFAGRLTRWLTQSCGVTALPESALYVISVVVVTLLLSYITLLLGESVPKRLAAVRAERAALALCGMVGVLTAVFRPVSWLLNRTTNGVLRLLRIDPKAADGAVSEDEILMMVDIGEEKGAIESSEKELIENIFEFNNTTAEDVMVHRTDMVMIWVDDPPEEILKIMEESGMSRFPVYQEDADDILGILSTRDYLFNTQRQQPRQLRELLRAAYFVPESVRTDVLFRDMQNKKVHMAIVVDEYGGTSGLVTMEDLLEEIVGNIYDEFDPQDEQDIIRLEDNIWKVAGTAELERLGEELGMDLPEDEEFDTLGGLVFSRLSVIPEDGSTVEVDAFGLHIKVIELSERRVEWALVSRLKQEDTEPED